MRLAVDIGGTFTDVVLMDPQGDIVASAKVLTSHANPATAALEGTRQALEATAASLADIDSFIHGTTLATNALIEKRGAVVATIATDGFRDILEIAYERRYSQYDINIEKPDLLVPRSRAFTIPERLSASGDVLLPLDESAISGLADEIKKCNADALAICLLHSYANPDHEQRLADALEKLCPDLSISLSSMVSPEAREFDRLCTTVANAYIQPLMSDYLHRFEQLFVSEGLQCPVLVMTAGGGMTTIKTAKQFPIRLVESGPAGGAILAARTARRHNLANVLSFDMGGTTAKLCLIDNARPQQSRMFEIARAERFIKGSGMPVRIPVVDMIEIGAGGGSIASVDHLGRLHIGPESAGSEPGPVAFGRGGDQPTVTDADVTLGFIQPSGFAEGRLKIDTAAASLVIDRSLGSAFGNNSQAKALGISMMVDENMASAARMHAVESGKNIGDRVMIAFGGNGPLHACRVARAAGVKKIVVPPNPGVGSAVGFLYAPVSYEVVKSFYTLLESLEPDKVNELLDSMVKTATEVVRMGSTQPLETSRSAFMRYQGQGHEIEISLPDGALQLADLNRLNERFEAAYSEQYSRPVPGMAVEILNWSVQVGTGSTEHETQLGTVRSVLHESVSEDVSYCVDRNSATALLSAVDIYCDVDASLKKALVIERHNLKSGNEVLGPALIVEPQTTTMVATDFRAKIDAEANIWLESDF